jgi:UDP-N-acetylmuramoyl-L-alanyl-D-glutamate--2,6-diaminopimelate ligase
VGVSLGISTPDILKGISRVTEVPGRFEKIPGPGFTVVVDYAHTDDALKLLLQNARQLCGNNLITIFGCGGDRDRGKRPIMGKIAADLSDRVIVTSDNPRTEEPERIIEEILAGIKDAGPVQVDVLSDRREAIRAGIQQAREGDMVVVAGKGHEDYQILGEKRIHFDDREEVRKALQKKDQVTG